MLGEYGILTNLYRHSAYCKITCIKIVAQYNSHSFQILVCRNECRDQLPSSYDTNCYFDCEELANLGRCDEDWSHIEHCFQGRQIPNHLRGRKIKEDCKRSCEKCSE